jgi:type IV pilus assembly protein PilV
MTHYSYSAGSKKSITAQRGVGLVEVLVALLLLAVAALGYTALQAKALKSTDESLTRTQALTLLRSTAEKIRTNGLGSTYELTVTENGTTTKTKAQILDYYQTLLNKAVATTAPAACADTGCSPEQMANHDVFNIKTQAQTFGINIGMTVCPGTADAGKTKCLVAAWNNTTPTLGAGSTDCMNAAGSYRFNADCVYMEAY